MAVSAEYRPERGTVMSDRPRSPDDRDVPSDPTSPFVLGPERWPVRDPLRAMVDDIRAVRQGGTIRILCGEAHFAIYDSQELRDALWYARHERKATTIVVSGPILLVRDGDSARPALLDLLRDKLISALYHRPHRAAVSHFRVVDTDDVPRYYAEGPHLPLLPVEQRTCANFDGLAPEYLSALAFRASESFEVWRDRSIEHHLAKKQRLPLLATEDDLARLVRLAWDRQMTLDNLASDELRALQPPGERLLYTLAEHHKRLKSRIQIHA